MKTRIALAVSTAVFASAAGVFATIALLNNDDSRPAGDTIAVITAPTRDTYTVNYQRGYVGDVEVPEWLFSNSTDGSFIVVSGQCPQEDSCTVEYADGAWTVRRVTP